MGCSYQTYSQFLKLVNSPTSNKNSHSFILYNFESETETEIEDQLSRILESGTLNKKFSNHSEALYTFTVYM